MKQACMTVGGAVWTMTYNVNADNTITILNFDKEANDGYMFQDSLSKLVSIKEGEGRVAEEVTIDNDVFVVANPQNVYTYKQPL